MNNNSNKSKTNNYIRIIAGKWRSRKLTFPSQVDTLRPTPDRVRETVFNWLQLKIVGARCLDLFSGSGAFAFESSSRGAASVTAIDNSAQVTEMIQQNCRLLDDRKIKTILSDGLKWIHKNTQNEQFDIIFLDPPYSENILSECCQLLASSNLLAPGCIIYLEANHSLEDITLPESWHLLKKKKAGQIYFGICEYFAS